MDLTAYLEEAYKLHREIGVIDSHCDTVGLFENKKIGYNFNLWNEIGHLDLPRMEAGGVKVQFFAVYIEPENKPHTSLHRTLQLIDTYYETLKGLEERIVPVTDFGTLKQVLEGQKIASILAIEGGEAIETDLRLLRMLYRLGVRSFGLTWNQRNQIADGIDERESGGGLTRFGFSVIRELNKLGMLIDLAHLSEAGFWDVLETSADPVIVSHANAYTICNHPRNLKDQQLKALAEAGGVIGLSVYEDFIKESNADLDSLADHFAHIASLIGVEHIGIGSDFDGIDRPVKGLEDVTKLPNLTAALLKRGFSKADMKKILRDNYLQLFNKVLKRGKDPSFN
ncbi:MAG: dipeptidase [Dethiobacteria bacterium]